MPFISILSILARFAALPGRQLRNAQIEDAVGQEDMQPTPSYDDDQPLPDLEAGETKRRGDVVGGITGNTRNSPPVDVNAFNVKVSTCMEPFLRADKQKMVLASQVLASDTPESLFIVLPRQRANRNRSRYGP